MRYLNPRCNDRRSSSPSRITIALWYSVPHWIRRNSRCARQARLSVVSDEEMLPNHQMPEAFYVYWSIPSPRDYAPSQRTKPTLFVEGKNDVAILRTILPPRVIDASKMRPAGGHHILVTEASKHVAQHHAAVAIVFDTDTLDKDEIDQIIGTMTDTMASSVGDTPFRIIDFTPHIEAIFFKSGISLQRIFPNLKEVYERELAKTDPKKQCTAPADHVIDG
jgi:hypothetical protein